MSGLQSHITRAVRTASSERSDYDLEVMISWLKKTNRIFNNVTRGEMLSLVRHCTYRRVEQHQIIVKQGEPGDSFYVIATGSVSVYIDSTLHDAPPPLPLSHQPPTPHPTADQPIATSPNDEQASTKSTDHQTDGARAHSASTHCITEEDEGTRDGADGGSAPEKLVKVTNRDKLGKFIVSLGAGQSFGELALLTDDSTRNATVISDVHTELIVINRQLFNSTLKAKQEEEYKMRCDFVDTNHLFADWGHKHRKALAMSLQAMTLNYDTTVVEQGGDVGGLHVIISGQCTVRIDTSRHQQQYPRLYETYRHRTGNSQLDEKPRTNWETAQAGSIRFRRQSDFRSAESRRKQRFVEVCLMNDGEIIGDIELCVGVDTYTQTVTTSTATQLFYIDSKTIERLFTRRHTNTMKLIEEQAEQKLYNRMHLCGSLQKNVYQMLHATIVEQRNKLHVTGPPARPADRKKQMLLKQMTELFVKQDKPMIVPSQEDTIQHAYRMMERIRLYRLHSMDKRVKPPSSPELRLLRARHGNGKKARSRRQLEKLLVPNDQEHLEAIEQEMELLARFPCLDYNHHQQQCEHHQQQQQQQQQLQQQSEQGKPHRLQHLDEEGVEHFFKLIELSDKNFEGHIELYPSDLLEGHHRLNVLKMKKIQRKINRPRQKMVSALFKEKTDQRLLATQVQHAGLGLESHENTDMQRQPRQSFSSRPLSRYRHCFDYITSEEYLETLERRMRDFHYNCDQHDKHGGGAVTKGLAHHRVVDLKPFEIKEASDVPLPGGLVCIRSRKCRCKPGPRHIKIKRFIVPKNSHNILMEQEEDLKSYLYGRR